MSDTIPARCFVFVGAVLMPALVHAAGFGIAEQGVVAAGMASAGTARADDPAAGWYNPAALADGKGWRLGLGLLLAKPSLSADLPADSESGRSATSWDTESRLATPPHLYVSYAHGNHALGLAAHVPYGGGVSWPADWDGRFYIVSSDLQFFRVAPFYAWRHGDVRLAAGLHTNVGHMRLHRKANFVDTEGTIRADLSGYGLGAEGALFFRAAPSVDVGLSIKTGARVAMSGDFDMDDAPDAFLGKVPDQSVRATMNLPHRIALGARWQEGNFAAACDITLEWWKVHERLVIDLEEEQSPDVRQAMNWKSVVSFRLGTEVALRDDLAVRGGLFLDPSPAPADTLSPSSPDSMRVGVTTGLSYWIGSSFSVDAFYEYLQILSREAENENSLAATYGGHAQLAGIGMRYVR